MDKILIDTDVILDFFFNREPFADDASGIFTLCETRKVKGFVTPVIISNVYYLLRKFEKHEKVISDLKKLLSIIDVALLNKEIILEALNSSFKDFEDGLQNYAAQSNKEISIIITRNIKDYKASNLSLMTPETYLKSIAS